MAETTTPISLLEQLQEYFATKLKLIKYEAVDKATAIIAEVITDIIVVILSLVTFVFFSVTLALFAGYLLGSYWEGFGCATLMYLIIALFARLVKTGLQNIFIRVFIQKIFKKRS